ncbi:MAG: hypothetical protein IPN89_05855 [Saprospiraceae bacterium]|nr:hypothetical protein [Saprospiraceae bacterium]
MNNNYILYNYSGGTLTNYGTITNNYHLQNEETGNILNFGTINTISTANLINNGSFSNEDYGNLNINGDGGTYYRLENNGTLINKASATINVNGALINYGLLEVSSGLLHIQLPNGRLENYFNASNVSGVVTNNHTINNYSPGTLTNNGTLKGTGTLNQYGTFTNNSSGIIAPGASPGKFTVNGNINLGSGTYQCEINGTGQGTAFDWLAISGTATLTNAKLIVDWGGYTPTDGEEYSILTSGSLSTQFATVTMPHVAGMRFTSSYADNKVKIIAERISYTF